MKISLHIHSEYSVDARQTVQSIVSESKRLGYDAIAITDHNTVAGSLAAAALPQDAVKIIPGAEFSTEKGHILALFIDEQIEKSVRRDGAVYFFDDLVAKVRAQDGLLFLAHPLQSEALYDPAFIADLDGYELVNGRIDARLQGPAGEASCGNARGSVPRKNPHRRQRRAHESGA